jgi:two-component system, chemotaxis family, protein-glutamate methylesterase/glutaminase
MTPPERTTPALPVVVVGASAGGIEALRELVRLLPRDFPACVLVVLHLAANAPSALPAILRRSTDLPVRAAGHGDRLRAGELLVAPPDHHLVITDGEVVLTHGPRENGHRPAVDVLFRSAARAWGGHVAGLVLSGALDDGAAGAVAISSRGGLVLAQEPEEALYRSMPDAAIRATGARGVPVREIPAALEAWLAELADSTDSTGPVPGEAGQVSPNMETEVGMAEMDPAAMHAYDRPGDPAGFGCPDCAGALFLIDEGGLRRYRCRVGHAWSPESLLAQQTSAMESALWMALRTLEEKGTLNRDLAGRAREGGYTRTAERFEDSAQDTEHAAELVRSLIDEIAHGAYGAHEDHVAAQDPTGTD